MGRRCAAATSELLSHTYTVAGAAAGGEAAAGPSCAVQLRARHVCAGPQLPASLLQQLPPAAAQQCGLRAAACGAAVLHGARGVEGEGRWGAGDRDTRSMTNCCLSTFQNSDRYRPLLAIRHLQRFAQATQAIDTRHKDKGPARLPAANWPFFFRAAHRASDQQRHLRNSAAGTALASEPAFLTVSYASRRTAGCRRVARGLQRGYSRTSSCTAGPCSKQAGLPDVQVR